MTAFDLLMLIAQAIERRRSMLPRRLRILFTVADTGDLLTLDTAQTPMLKNGGTTVFDTHILCNTQAIKDLIVGRLGDRAWVSKQLFLCQGDRQVFLVLADCLESTPQSLSPRDMQRLAAFPSR